MRLIILTLLLFSCGADVSQPEPLDPIVCEPRAESEIEDCEVNGVGVLGEFEGRLLEFNTKQQLEALCAQPCGRFNGVIQLVKIDGVENLKALQNLRKVDGLIVGELSDLRNFDGIEALDIDGTGYLTISGNPKLESIAALTAPEVFGRPADERGEPLRLYIGNNPKLKSLRGLENLQELGNAEMSIEFNDSLKNLEGLNNLRVLGRDIRLEIKQNAGLESLDGLDSVESGAGIGINFNAVLTDISDSLPSLKSLDFLGVEGNPKVSPCEVEAIAARADIAKVVNFDNGGTQLCD